MILIFIICTISPPIKMEGTQEEQKDLRFLYLIYRFSPDINIRRLGFHCSKEKKERRIHKLKSLLSHEMTTSQQHLSFAGKHQQGSQFGVFYFKKRSKSRQNESVTLLLKAWYTIWRQDKQPKLLRLCREVSHRNFMCAEATIYQS